MPDDNGKLSGDEKQKITDWLKTKSKDSPCPSCGENMWFIGDHIINAVTFHPKGPFILGGPSYPQFMLVCGNCLYVMQFMAMPLGIIPLPKDKQETQETKGEKTEEPKTTVPPPPPSGDGSG